MIHLFSLTLTKPSYLFLFVLNHLLRGCYTSFMKLKVCHSPPPVIFAVSGLHHSFIDFFYLF